MQPLPSQLAMLRLAAQRPDSGGLIIETAWRATGPAQAQALATAATRALAEAEVAGLGGVVDPDGTARFVAVDRAPVPILDFATEADLARWRRSAGLAFDGGPLVRAAIARVGTDRVVLLRGHHTVVDGYAVVLLLRRIAEHYRAVGGGAPSPRATLGDLGALAATAVLDTPPDPVFWDEAIGGLGTPGVDIAFTARTAPLAGRPRRHRVTVATPGLAARRTWPSEVIGTVGAYTAGYLGTAEARIGVIAALRHAPLERATPVQWTAVVPTRLPVAPGDDAAALGARVRRWLDAAVPRVRGGERPEQLRTTVPAAWRLGRVHGPVVNVLPYVHVEGFAVDIGAWGPVEDCLINVIPGEGDTLTLDGAFHRALYDDTDAVRHVEGIAALLTAALAAPDAPLPAIAVRQADPRRVPIPGGWIVPDEAIAAVTAALRDAGLPHARVRVRDGAGVTVELTDAGDSALPIARSVLPPGVRVRLA